VVALATQGPVTQWLEYHSYKMKVAGSIPVWPTRFMIETKQIQVPLGANGIDHAEEIKQILFDDGVVVIRGNSFSEMQQVELMNELGGHFDWEVTKEFGGINRYEEDLSYAIKLLADDGISASQNGILLAWHLEHVYRDFPPAAAIWNMVKFQAPKGHGSCGFYDSQKLVSLMPDKWVNFLESAEILSHTDEIINPRKALSVSKTTGEKTIRIRTESDDQTDLLHSVDGRTPSEEEIKLFRQIHVWIVFNVWGDTKNRIIHTWEEGDLLVLDLNRISYCFMGGIKPGDIKFVSYSAF